MKVELGFMFAILIDGIKKGDPFCLIICQRPLFKNDKTFTDNWGQEWMRGDMLVGGFCYERRTTTVRGRVITYELLKDKPAYGYLHHMICSGFAMLLCTSTRGLQQFSMCIDTWNDIVHAVECRQNSNFE